MTKLPNPKLCIKCSRRGKVTETRAVPTLGARRRHHVCRCGHEWNTYETSLHPSLIEQVLEATGLGTGRQVVSISTPGRTVVRKP